MHRFLIVFPNHERLDFYLSEIENEMYYEGNFPLFKAIERHIKRFDAETSGAKIYEVVKGEEKNHYVHLTTFNY